MPKKSKTAHAPAVPSWAGAAFQITATDDVMDSFYAPTPVAPATVPAIQSSESAAPEPPATAPPQLETSAAPVAEPLTTEAPKPAPRRNLLGRSTRAAKEINRAAQTGEPVPTPYQNFTLKELLPGKALDLYATLYTQTHAAQPVRSSVRLTKNSLRAAADIANVKTANAHEKYLIALGLIARYSVAGDHDGSTYEVKPLEELGLNENTVGDFYDYLNRLPTKV